MPLRFPMVLLLGANKTKSKKTSSKSRRKITNRNRRKILNQKKVANRRNKANQAIKR